MSYKGECEDQRISWAEFFLSQAFAWATRSKIKTTKVGCVLVGAQKENVSVGYNGPPRSFPDSYMRSLSREHLRAISTHAEINAITNAARLGVSTMGATAYISAPPCAQCAAALINAGVVKIVCTGDLHPDWKESTELGQWLLAQCATDFSYVVFSE